MHEVLDQIAADQAELGIDLSDQEAAELADRLVAEDRKEQSRRPQVE